MAVPAPVPPGGLSYTTDPPPFPGYYADLAVIGENRLNQTCFRSGIIHLTNAVRAAREIAPFPAGARVRRRRIPMAGALPAPAAVLDGSHKRWHDRRDQGGGMLGRVL